MFVDFKLTAGDFIDRYTIAQIKAEKIGIDSVKKDFETRFKPIFKELAESPLSYSVFEVYYALLEVNLKLWDIEDKIRSATEDFELADLSKSIISLNDARAFHKKALDEVFGTICDQKMYRGENRNYTI